MLSEPRATGLLSHSALMLSKNVLTQHVEQTRDEIKGGRTPRGFAPSSITATPALRGLIWVHPECFSPTASLQGAESFFTVRSPQVPPSQPPHPLLGNANLALAVKGAAVAKAAFPSRWVESERQPAIHLSLL